MAWIIRYHAMAELPKLAWLASLELGGGHLAIVHGSAVECHDTWMAEGVWDGDFERGDFHRSENFFGSGARVEGDKVYFVPSSALVDRLFYCLNKNRMLVSNSLILLLAFTGAELDSTHDYKIESHTILKGIKQYKKDFTVLHRDIRKFYQVYHENIIVEKGGVSFDLRSRVHGLGSFGHYYTLLNEILIRLKYNYESPIRRIQLDAFTTLSSGYDSTAVTCLAKTLGVKTCFTSKRSASPVPSWAWKSLAIDDGHPIAQTLQLESLYLDRASRISTDELYFYATDPTQAELVFHTMATHIEKTCQAAVVFTGYHGDKTWDANLPSKYVNDQIIRGDLSGLRLSEIRLKSGFIHVAVPFILARSVESISKISRSSEMEPWRLHNSYDRPIPRRIGESAGIDRGLFGMRKKMVSDREFYPRNAQLRRQFFEFLKKNYNMRPAFVYLYVILNKSASLLIRTVAYIQYFTSAKTLSVPPDTSLLGNKHKPRTKVFWKHIDFHSLLFFWSVKVASKRTAEMLQQDVSTSARAGGIGVLNNGENLTADATLGGQGTSQAKARTRAKARTSGHSESR